MKKPNYTIEDRTQLILAGQTRSIERRSDGTYDVFNETAGTHCIWNINEVLSFLKMPGVAAAQLIQSVSGAATALRAGQRLYKDTLSPACRDQIDFRKALILGVDAVEAEGFAIYQAALDKKEVVLRVIKFAEKIYTTRPIVWLQTEQSKVRGGSRRDANFVPGGRTIWKYRERYYDHDCDELVLADKDHLKGNRSNHGVSPRMWELIRQAVDEIYMDKKGASPAAAHAYLETLFMDENERRQQIGLAPFKMVSQQTVRREIKKISPTARAVARDGKRAAQNDHLRGLTETHALKFGEQIELDECRLSLMTLCKEKGWWEKFSKEEKRIVEEIEEILTTRLWLIVALDVATRLPLGWTLTENPDHEATLDVLRMATRDKTKEKVLYGCESDPAPAVGLLAVKTDNGAGLRNAPVKRAALGILAQSVDCRSYHSGDRPYIERFFGSNESQVFSLIHGYTGRKAGHLKGYDPIKNAVFDADELFGIITRYFVDEYPFRRHGGSTMRGMRPIEAYNYANDNYGCVAEIPEMTRRIHLGWRSEATVTHEGVRVFGLPYSSEAIQVMAESKNRKVTVFSDPDCVNEVTVLQEGNDTPVLGELTWTMMSDLTVAEALEFQAYACSGPTDGAADYETRLLKARKRRHDDVKRKGLEEKLPRSFMTIAEAEAKAQTIIQVRNARQEPLSGTASPGEVSAPSSTGGIFKVGSGFDGPIDSDKDAPPATSEATEKRHFGRPKSEGNLK